MGKSERRILIICRIGTGMSDIPTEKRDNQSVRRIDSQRDIHTGCRIGRQTDQQTNKQTDRQTEGQKDMHTDIQTDKHTYG
jgi:hypothetical protein